MCNILHIPVSLSNVKQKRLTKKNMHAKRSCWTSDIDPPLTCFAIHRKKLHESKIYARSDLFAPHYNHHLIQKIFNIKKLVNTTYLCTIIDDIS